MIVLHSYPELFGLPDNNPFGLKVYAFLKLAGLPFRQEHIFDAKAAPRGQLPYIDDDGEIVGDSDAIIAHLIGRHGLTIDDGLSTGDRDTTHLLGRMLEQLYWVMSYSRWRDPQFWPLFRDALLRTHEILTAASLEAAQQYNFQRYYYQGIGRYEPAQVYDRGLADLRVLADIVGDKPFLLGDAPRSADAAAYGFLANILFYDIPTPLKAFIVAHPQLQRYCLRLHEAVAK
ncbi:MAG: glutathione S-transferase family protein [Hyphomicrobiales bacterium]|nr:glutathione S-transferase family protein [Hyphomicrobiales bacterium]